MRVFVYERERERDRETERLIMEMEWWHCRELDIYAWKDGRWWKYIELIGIVYGLKHQRGTVLGHLPINQRTWGMKQETNISWYCSIVEHVQQLGEHDMYSMNTLFVDKCGNKVNEPGFWKSSRKLGAAYIPMEFLGNSQLSSIVLVSDVVTRKCKPCLHGFYAGYLLII